MESVGTVVMGARSSRRLRGLVVDFVLLELVHLLALFRVLGSADLDPPMRVGDLIARAGEEGVDAPGGRKGRHSAA